MLKYIAVFEWQVLRLELPVSFPITILYVSVESPTYTSYIANPSHLPDTFWRSVSIKLRQHLYMQFFLSSYYFRLVVVVVVVVVIVIVVVQHDH